MLLFLFLAILLRVLGHSENPNLLNLKDLINFILLIINELRFSFLDKKEAYVKSALYQKHHRVLEDLLGQDAIEFIVMRGSQNEYVVSNQQGESIIKMNADQRLSYHPDTADVFGIGEISDGMNYRESFEHTFESDYPDCLWQCHQLMQSHRAGDVVISAASGYDLRDFWEIPEHKGSHGSLHWEHMHVPILTNQKDHIKAPIRTADVNTIIKNWID